MAERSDRFLEVKALFQSVVEQSPDSWTRYLDEACGDDHELKALVMSLLEEDGQPHDVLARLEPLSGFSPLVQVKETGPPVATCPPASIGRYAVLEELGRGGMGIVYLAEDPDLRRRLAIKVLPPEWRQRPTCIRRLEREARMLAALRHPNVAALHTLERDGETHFLTMELIDGVTLSSLIQQEGLDADQAFLVCDQIAAALEVAHANGMVHRDLKPANVMVDSDHRVKVLDFGLAKMLVGPSTEDDGPVSVTTGVGHWHGTPGYMSPEQVRGEPADERSDIWMFGCTLFECLTRRPAFPGATAADRMVAALHDTPDWSALPSAISTSALQVLEASLARSPSERPESVAEIRRVLQSGPRSMRPPGDHAHQSASAVGKRHLTPINDRIASTPPADLPSLAVLPFVDRSRRQDQDYFCDGLAEELIDIMSRTPGLRVVARTSSFAFKGQAVDVREVGIRLGVQAVLGGKVRIDGRGLRIDVSLTDVRAGSQVWSDRYDGDLADVLSVQVEIASAIADALKVELLKPSILIPRRRISAEAHALYLRGQYFVNLDTRTAYERAIECFKEAIELVPDYAPAYVGLANAYIMLGASFFQARLFREAKTVAETATELDPSLAAGFTALGYGTWIGYWDWTGAFRNIQRAIAINPSYAIGHSYMGTFYMSAARFSDSLVSYGNALDLDPLYVFSSQFLGAIYLRANRTREAQDHLLRALEMNPRSPAVHWLLGQAYVVERRFDDGIAELEHAIRIGDRLPTIVGSLGWAHARAGRLEMARGILDELRSRSHTEHVGSYCLAKVAAGMGDRDAALGYLEDAWRAGDYLWLVSVLTDESFRGLRGDPRYLDLVDRLGLRKFWDARDWPEDALVE